MKKKEIIIILVILIVGFLVWKYMPAGSTSVSLSTGTPVTQAESVQTKVDKVYYDGLNFIPSTIVVNKGDSVTFINSTTGKMSVASNPHPSHTDYPEFDQYKSSAKGLTSFTFVFDKVGVWGYHNHAAPNIGGTITVIAK